MQTQEARHLEIEMGENLVINVIKLWLGHLHRIFSIGCVVVWDTPIQAYTSTINCDSVQGDEFTRTLRIPWKSARRRALVRFPAIASPVYLQ